MQNKLQIEINAPSIEEYHDILYHIQQQIDLGFTHGSESSTQPFFKDDVNFKWKIESDQKQSLHFSDGSSIFDDPLL